MDNVTDRALIDCYQADENGRRDGPASLVVFRADRWVYVAAGATYASTVLMPAATALDLARAVTVAATHAGRPEPPDDRPWGGFRPT